MTTREHVLKGCELRVLVEIANAQSAKGGSQVPLRFALSETYRTEETAAARRLIAAGLVKQTHGTFGFSYVSITGKGLKALVREEL